MLRPTFIVGMYQQCRKQKLSIGCEYRCRKEPDNQFDKNAVAVYDGTRRVAYIRRENALHISKIMSAVPYISVSVRPEKEPEYSNRGPTQFCSLIIVIRKRDVDVLEASVSGTGLFFS